MNDRPGNSCKLPRDTHFLPTEPIILLAILNSDEECVVVVVVCRAGKLAMVEQRARLKSNRFKGAWLD